MILAGRRLRPVFRSKGIQIPDDLELPYRFGGRGRDVAFDLEDVARGEIVKLGLTEREELDVRNAESSS